MYACTCVKHGQGSARYRELQNQSMRENVWGCQIGGATREAAGSCRWKMQDKICHLSINGEGEIDSGGRTGLHTMPLGTEGHVGLCDDAVRK